MKKSAAKTPASTYKDILMSERIKLSSLEITPSISMAVTWISFFQNIFSLVHIFGFSKFGYLELAFAFFSPNVFIILTRLQNAVAFAIAINLLLVLVPLVYYLRLVIERRQQRKFNPPGLYELIVNKSRAFGYFNYILIPLIVLPFFEMNLFLNICYGTGLAVDPYDDYSFHQLNAVACSDHAITILRVITSISELVICLHLIMLIHFIFSRQQSDSNHLSNESKTVDWIQLARKLSLGLYVLPKLIRFDIIQLFVIIFAFLVNLTQIGFYLTRFSHFNQKITRLAIKLSICELFFTTYITLNLILLRIGLIEEVDQIYLPLFGIVSYISASFLVDKFMQSIMRPLRHDESVTWCIKRLKAIYYFMKESSNGMTLVPRLGEDCLEDQLLSYFRSHFLSCNSPSCICYRIKCKEDIYDLGVFKNVDYSEDLSSQDGVITVTAKVFYLKNFIWSRLKELEAVNSENKEVLFALLKFEVFEMKNFIRACELIRILEKKRPGSAEHYELGYLRIVIQRYYEFDFNHRIKKEPFYNLEKFIDIQNSVLEIEDTIYASMRSFYKTLFYLVDLIGEGCFEARQDPRLVEKVARGAQLDPPVFESLL